jgi:hypothetical protein
MSPALHPEEGTQRSPRLVACLAVVGRSQTRAEVLVACCLAPSDLAVAWCVA